MTLLLDIAPFSPPATPRDTGRDIYRRFEDDPDVSDLIVRLLAGMRRLHGLSQRH